MPSYTFQCTSCERQYNKFLAISQHSQPQPCPFCQSAGERVLKPMSFNLKGDDWAGKTITVLDERKRKNAYLDSKQDAYRRDCPTSLVPNVGGEIVDTWADAKQLAKEKGIDSTSYEARAVEEKAK